MNDDLIPCLSGQGLTVGKKGGSRGNATLHLIDGGSTYFGSRGSVATGLRVVAGLKMPPTRPAPKPAPETVVQSLTRRLATLVSTHEKATAIIVAANDHLQLRLDAALTELAKHGKEVATNNATAWIIDTRETNLIKP